VYSTLNILYDFIESSFHVGNTTAGYQDWRKETSEPIRNARERGNSEIVLLYSQRNREATGQVITIE
jgi:hypothetical protein